MANWRPIGMLSHQYAPAARMAKVKGAGEEETVSQSGCAKMGGGDRVTAAAVPSLGLQTF